MIAYFYYSSLVHNNNLVSISNGAQPMGYDHNGSVLKGRTQGAHYFLFIDCV